jgi:cyanobactin maturation PatA/PatG family protease
MTEQPEIRESSVDCERVAAADEGGADDSVGASGIDAEPAAVSPVQPAQAAVAAATQARPGMATEQGGQVSASSCTCGGGKPAQLVFALGQLGFDYGTEARRDSIAQHMKQPVPYDARQLSAHLDDNPWEAAEIIWTLNLDATPIYAVAPQGPFGSHGCDRLCSFLKDQLDEGVERVSIPGWIAGSVRLFSGQVVPVIQPVLRGMYSWTTAALVDAVCGKAPARGASRKDKEAYAQKVRSVENFLRRVYDELRNLGTSPQERAINYSATNALLVSGVFEDAIREEMELDTIEVERSPICRPDSDCYDVKLTFFDPGKVFQRARKVYRFTIDVSDAVPVMVGEVRAWFVR